MKNSRLICFIGIDGTGKTTLARRLAQELTHEGYRARYVMARFEKFVVLQPVRWLAKKIFLSGKKTDHSLEGARNKSRYFKNRFLAGVWQWAVFCDYLIQIGYKVRLPLLFGRWVCTDRYIYDTVVDLAVDLSLPADKMSRLLNMLLRLSPRPGRVFLIELTENLAFQRNLVKHDNVSMDYLRARRNLYSSFSGRPEVTVLDGSPEHDAVFRMVLKTLEEKRILS